MTPPVIATAAVSPAAWKAGLALERYLKARATRERANAARPDDDPTSELDDELRAERAAIAAIREAAQGDRSRPCGLLLGGRLAVVLADGEGDRGDSVDFAPLGGQIQVVDRLAVAQGL